MSAIGRFLARTLPALLILVPASLEGKPAVPERASLNAVHLGDNRPEGRQLLYGLQARGDVLLDSGESSRPRFCVECAGNTAFLTFEIPTSRAGRALAQHGLGGRLDLLEVAGDLEGRIHFHQAFEWVPDSIPGVWRVPDSSAWLSRLPGAGRLEIRNAEGRPLRFDLDTFVADREAARARCRRATSGVAPDSITQLPEILVRRSVRYPRRARDLELEGHVVIHARVAPDGKVSETRRYLSLPMFDEAAVEAVKRYRFRPALAGGRPVAAWVAVPIRFRLH